jgi:hypothetical protein
VGLGTELIETHDRLRAALEELRAGAASFPADCLALCSAVRAHHGDEDGGLFPRLAAAAPELAPVLAELRRDHEVIAGLIARFGTSPSDVDTLAALLETHFSYEERTLVRALDAL